MTTKAELIAWRNRGYDDGIAAKPKAPGLAAAREHGGPEAVSAYLASFKRGLEERARLAGSAGN